MFGRCHFLLHDLKRRHFHNSDKTQDLGKACANVSIVAVIGGIEA